MPYCLKSLGFSPNSTKKILRSLSRAALVASYHIWLARNDKEWVPDTIQWEPLDKTPCQTQSSHSTSISCPIAQPTSSIDAAHFSSVLRGPTSLPSIHAQAALSSSVSANVETSSSIYADIAIPSSIPADAESSTSSCSADPENEDSAIDFARIHSQDAKVGTPSNIVDLTSSQEPTVVDLTSSQESIVVDLTSSPEPTVSRPSIPQPSVPRAPVRRRPVRCPSVPRLPVPYPTRIDLTSSQEPNTLNDGNDDDYLISQEEILRTIEIHVPLCDPRSSDWLKTRTKQSPPLPSVSSSQSPWVNLSAPPGLINLGNTCYANAILHCLFYLPELWKSIPTEYFSQRPLLQSLKAALMCLNTKCAGKPTVFLRSLQSHITALLPPPNRFDYNKQQDGYEVLGFIVKEMQTAYMRPELLSTTVVTLCRCLTCFEGQNVQTVDNPSLSLPFSDSVINALQQVRVSGKVTRRCWKCKVNRLCSEDTHFSHLPDVLIVRVERSKFDAVSLVQTKLHGKIVCEKVLSLPLGVDGPVVTYHLSSVIHHSGNSIRGHYTATLCDPHNNKMWYCNDSDVRKTKRIDYKTACVFFYRKEE